LSKTALVLGYTGQDGQLLTKLLLQKGYEVFGSSRNFTTDVERKNNPWIKDVKKVTIIPGDFRSVLIGINKSKPEEIYNLSGQSSVGYSFDDPNETLTSISGATQNILEVLRITGSNSKFYNAGSSEMFGETPSSGATEISKISPKSPYGVAKAASFFQTEIYRKAYDINCCTGILFNHESEFRSKNFVTYKILETAIRISRGEKTKLIMGRTDIQRDWGYAGEYVEAMWKMLQYSKTKDYVIASGKAVRLIDFIAEVFKQLNLNYIDYIETDKSLLRPHDIIYSRGNPIKANDELNWKASYNLSNLVCKLLIGFQNK
jgi:GDPmannose 4,6-dehydratase